MLSVIYEIEKLKSQSDFEKVNLDYKENEKLYNIKGKKEVIERTLLKLFPDLNTNDIKVKEKPLISSNQLDRNVLEGEFTLNNDWKISVTENDLVSEIIIKNNQEKDIKKESVEFLRKKSTKYINLIYPESLENLEFIKKSKNVEQNYIIFIYRISEGVFSKNKIIITLKLDGELSSFYICGDLKK